MLKTEHIDLILKLIDERYKRDLGPGEDRILAEASAALSELREATAISFRLPNKFAIAGLLENQGYAYYAGHRIAPVPFSLEYEVNGPDIDGQRYGDLEEALAAIRATIQEPA